MKEWIGYYEDVLSNELSKNIVSDTWEWKPSTYSTHEGIAPNSKNKVVMDGEKAHKQMMKSLGSLFESNKDFKIAFAREAMSGFIKFGKNNNGVTYLATTINFCQSFDKYLSYSLHHFYLMH